MIIQCPACSSRYRIQEDKLPADGGNIRCPNCAHVFFVTRDGATHPERAAQSAAPREAEQAVVANAPPPTPPSLPDPFEDEPSVRTGKHSATGQRWRLKNAVGLIYDFPDTEQLRRWLSSRDSFDGITVSADGGASWRDVASVDDLADLRPTGRKALGGGGPVTIPRHTASNPRVTDANSAIGTATTTTNTAEKLREEAEQRLKAARDSRKGAEPAPAPPPQFRLVTPAANAHQAQTSRVLLWLSVAILPFVAIAGLHLAGVIDLRDWGLLGGRATTAPVQAAAGDDELVDDGSGRVEFSPEQAVSILLTQASAAQTREEWDVAAQHLDAAIELMPDDRQLYCLAQPVYERLNRAADAATARQRCTPPATEGSGEPPDADAASDADAAADADAGSDAAAPAAPAPQ